MAVTGTTLGGLEMASEEFRTRDAATPTGFKSVADQEEQILNEDFTNIPIR